MVYNGNPYSLMDDLGVPLFLETPTFTSTQTTNLFEFKMLVFGWRSLDGYGVPTVDASEIPKANHRCGKTLVNNRICSSQPQVVFTPDFWLPLTVSSTLRLKKIQTTLRDIYHMGVSLNGGFPHFTPQVLIIFSRKTHGFVGLVPPF